MPFNSWAQSDEREVGFCRDQYFKLLVLWDFQLFMISLNREQINTIYATARANHCLIVTFFFLLHGHSSFLLDSVVGSCYYSKCFTNKVNIQIV